MVVKSQDPGEFRAPKCLAFCKFRLFFGSFWTFCPKIHDIDIGMHRYDYM